MPVTTAVSLPEFRSTPWSPPPTGRSWTIALCLSPDIIWLVICQGVANHINANADELRRRLVRHEGKIPISIRRDDFVKGSPENPWAEAIKELTKKVAEQIGSEFALFEPAFTTTGPVERAAAGVVLLDAMQSYFTYDVQTLCGIPTVSLEGIPEDWQAVADRAEQFGSLGLEWWLKPLRGILKQFVAASQGDADREFWRSLYKYHNQSGGPVITGWISAVFPYLKDHRTRLATNRNPWLTLPSQRAQSTDDELDEELDDIDIDEEDDDRQGRDLDSDKLEVPGQRTAEVGTQEGDLDRDDEFDDELDVKQEFKVYGWLSPNPKRRRNQEAGGFGFWNGLSLSALPGGMSRAPFRWEHLDRTFDMEFLGGFVGVRQEKETLAVKPEIGWAVREAPATE